MTDKAPITVDDLAALASAVEEATKAYEDAERRCSLARGAETAARNSLNDAQKAFDDMLAQFTNQAPRDSDWGDAKHRKRNVAA